MISTFKMPQPGNCILLQYILVNYPHCSVRAVFKVCSIGASVTLKISLWKFPLLFGFLGTEHIDKYKKKSNLDGFCLPKLQCN